jgi:ubiquinone/menaquinone biosynthesis C-methylase UbiE
MQARTAFDTGPGARHSLRGAVGDVRSLPFRDASFDAIYSMGTIEWLRMLDLACHSWCRPLAVVSAALVWPFILADRHIPRYEDMDTCSRWSP